MSEAICPTCHKEFTGEEAEFVLDIGECGSCDHVRGDVMADLQDSEERLDDNQE